MCVGVLVKRPGQSGLSLIEVLVAMMLLSVALMGLAVAFPHSRKAVTEGNNLTAAVNLARQTLEGMRNRRFSSTVDEITLGNFPNQAYGTIPNFPRLRREVQIDDGVPEAQCVPAPPTPCTKRVTVRVYYRDEQGQERPVSLSMIFVR
jgi:prepilin-type N-terminal cleavage/methylation domain-containing protein